MGIMDFEGEKCRKCHQYLRDEGSDYCAPCNTGYNAKKAYRDASGNCRGCAQEHFADTRGEVPAKRFKEPMCNQANPWCLYYEASLKIIAGEMPTTAAMLSRIRSIMKDRMNEERQ
jgi:hypothetical protein